jgi:hypothetical protein
MGVRAVIPLVDKERRLVMAKFPGRKGDFHWGIYDYPVTFTQKATLDGLWYMLSGLPKALGQEDKGDYALPQGCYYSQNSNDGGVIIGLNHQSVTVHRNGRITSNERSIGDYHAIAIGGGEAVAQALAKRELGRA